MVDWLENATMEQLQNIVRTEWGLLRYMKKYIAHLEDGGPSIDLSKRWRNRE